MLRRTVERAFAAPPGEPVAPRDPGVPRTRLEAIRRIFRQLEEAFGARALRGVRVTGAPVGGAVTVRGRHGLEFEAETPSGTYRFLNTLAGTIEVDRVSPQGLVPVEVLSVQTCGAAAYVPIRKPAATERSGFEFTSVRALEESYLRAPDSRRGRAAGSGRGGVQNVDTG